MVHHHTLMLAATAGRPRLATHGWRVLFALKVIAANLTDAEIKELFQTLDKDNSGTIKPSEVCDFPQVCDIYLLLIS